MLNEKIHDRIRGYEKLMVLITCLSGVNGWLEVGCSKFGEGNQRGHAPKIYAWIVIGDITFIGNDDV